MYCRIPRKSVNFTLLVLFDVNLYKVFAPLQIKIIGKYSFRTTFIADRSMGKQDVWDRYDT